MMRMLREIHRVCLHKGQKKIVKNQKKAALKMKRVNKLFMVKLLSRQKMKEAKVSIQFTQKMFRAAIN